MSSRECSTANCVNNPAEQPPATIEKRNYLITTFISDWVNSSRFILFRGLHTAKNRIDPNVVNNFHSAR